MIDTFSFSLQNSVGFGAVQNTHLLTEIFCYRKVAVLIMELLLQSAHIQMVLLCDGHS